MGSMKREIISIDGGPGVILPDDAIDRLHARGRESIAAIDVQGRSERRVATDDAPRDG